MDTKNIETLLEAEISEDLGHLSDLELGSEEYKITVDKVAKLMDKAIELRRVEVDAQEKDERLKLEERKVAQEANRLEQDKFNKLNEQRLEQEKINNDKKNHLIQSIIGIAGIVIPTVVTIWGTVKTLKFEETGTVTTIMGRGFINKLLPKK